jgi:hypothetical protein
MKCRENGSTHHKLLLDLRLWKIGAARRDNAGVPTAKLHVSFCRKILQFETFENVEGSQISDLKSRLPTADSRFSYLSYELSFLYSVARPIPRISQARVLLPPT